MSRSGYNEDCDGWGLIRWRGQVASAIRGKRGQQLLKDLLAALDAMPEKQLIAGELVTANGEFCALGAVANYRGVVVSDVDPYDNPNELAKRLNVATQLVREIEFINDEWYYNQTPEGRWWTVRKWVQTQIVEKDNG